MPVIDLGTVNLVGTTQAVAVAGAQGKAYRFTLPEGTSSLGVGLQNNEHLITDDATLAPTGKRLGRVVVTLQ